MNLQSIDPTARIGEGVVVWDFTYIGRNTIIGARTRIGNLVHIDHDVVIGEDCGIEGSAYICCLTRIGNRVFIGPHATFINDHYPAAYRRFGQVKLSPTIVEDDAVIGAGAVIGPGLRIGKNAVVGMGSVVIKDVYPNQVVVGNPAQLLYFRNLYNVKQQEYNI